MKIFILFSAAFILAAQLSAGPNFDRSTIDRDPAVPMLSPGESMAKTEVAPGFKLELVAAEPMVEEPVCMAWGPDGELYVAEMHTYMLDVDMKDEDEPVSRVVKLVDTNGDGKMDKRTIYLDKVRLPRAILTLDSKVLIGAPPNLWLCEDTNNDGVADKKEIVYENYGDLKRNVEHDINGLQWNLDNWIYNAKSSVRLKYKDGKIEDDHVVNAGQWGHTINDRGERFNTTNTVPSISSFFPAKYVKGHFLGGKHTPLMERSVYDEKYQATWAMQGTPDTQGGAGMGREEDGSLKRFTAVCGQLVFRGDKLGSELYGTYWAMEPVGRLIRASKLNYKNGYAHLENLFEGRQMEFVASRDPNFRPVNAYTAPDGTLQFIDMYRGIIQHGNWTREGTYLRKQIQRRALDKNVGKGRIYRIVKEGVAPGKPPRFSTAGSAELVSALSHPNGWVRDEAQKLLVLRGNQDAIPLLKNVAANAENELGRVHAIWALEGLGAWTSELATRAVKDQSMDVRLAALRASDELIQAGDPVAVTAVADALADDTVDIAAQRLCSLSLVQKDWKNPSERSGHIKRVLEIAAPFSDREIVSLAGTVALNNAEYLGALRSLATKPGFNNKNNKLVQALSFAVLCTENKENIASLVDLASHADNAFAEAMLLGLRKGYSNNKVVAGELMKFEAKPEGYTRLEQKGLSKYAMAPLKEMLTWPGDYKYHLASALTPLSDGDQARFDAGREIYRGLCAACHGPNGEGMNMPEGNLRLAPPLTDSARVLDKNSRYFAAILLKGMNGPIDGVNYGGSMAPMESQSDEWLASIMTYVRRSWGNAAEPVTPSEVKKYRGWNKRQTVPFTMETLGMPKPKSSGKKQE